jgi:hypothetical protein
MSRRNTARWRARKAAAVRRIRRSFCRDISRQCRSFLSGMKTNLLIFSCSLILCFFIFLGCTTPPHPDAWNLPDSARPAILEANSWPVLSTNQYARVTDSKLDEALALLQGRSCIQLSHSQTKAMAPDLQAIHDLLLQPYLVRAVSYSVPPVLTVVRFDPEKAGILIKQFTYNGEMFWPYWRKTHNAIIAYLPKAPQAVYPLAVLGGDGVGTGEKWVDRR